MYVDIIAALRHEIIKWLKVDCVPEDDLRSTQHDYPYITYKLYDDWQQFEFKIDSPNFNIAIQFKVVSNDEDVQHELKYNLRRLFILSEPASYLSTQGIALLSVQDLPSPMNYVENEIIFDDGLDMTFNVHHEDDDFTIPNDQIDDVYGTFNNGEV